MSKLKVIGPGHAASVSRSLSTLLKGTRYPANAGGWSVQAAHDGVLVLISKHYDSAEVLLALQLGGYIYTTKNHHKGTTVKVTHRKAA